MKKKEWEEIKSLTKEELISKCNELQKNLLELKIKHKIIPLKNPHQMTQLKRNIARIKTLLWINHKIKL